MIIIITAYTWVKISVVNLTCAICMEATPTMFFINHFTHSEPVNIRTPELSTYMCNDVKNIIRLGYSSVFQEQSKEFYSS